VQKAVKAIVKAAKTGKIGDGKVFVLEIQGVYGFEQGNVGPMPFKRQTKKGTTNQRACSSGPKKRELTRSTNFPGGNLKTPMTRQTASGDKGINL
jgi:hypothetical protein